ncbi:long-chain fatty acid transport protein 4-like isoform X2 [Portunus trituberculatus]|uniref:long-chain fatty acid transport protein 4-like isoform X2 n=1 Tax=Portunus trituberculatus TaxID=210409 RepID=UPI001E1CB1CF|nr:long-chain fatty acid transport protein 4-like isoform X2 [Portunus trituberculatus]
MWPSAIAVGVTSVLWYAINLNIYLVIAICSALYISLGGSLTIWQIYKTFPRDFKGLVRFIKLTVKLKHAQRNNLSVPKAFRIIAEKNRNKVAFYFEDETWTFGQVDELSNRIGNYFASQGIKHGDSVAVFLENRVEYVCLWLGLTKIGAIPALINYNLRLEPLVHCIKVASCKAIVCGAEVQPAICDIYDREEISSLPVYVYGPREEEIAIKGGIDLDSALPSAPTTVPPQLMNVNFIDNMVYIYTSGTTGLPKAAIIKHSRGYMAMIAGTCMIGLTDDDIVYSPLPLYHLAAGLLGSGQALCHGNTVVLKRKFSVSAYWKDCVKYKCTAGQYIGEICRYLLNMPEKPEDSQHKIRIMFGNGLRPTIWEEFQKRFNVPIISEFYGSTEGNANIINIDGKVGAVGFVSVLFPTVYPVALLKVDEETREIVRDSNGLCIRCKPGEAGEFIGKIIQNDPIRDFHGYADQNATKKKVVKDVFKKGDFAFLSGDILVMDDEGYLYFKDRTGDTFRWKGENVSTIEVENVISRVTGLSDVIVYGVEVPGTEGRAGMAAILDREDTLDLEKLYDGMAKSLASYARPLFIRTVKEIEMTGTFKLKKVTVQKEGFNINIIKDKVFFLDAKKRAYVPLTADIYNKIISGEMRL